MFSKSDIFKKIAASTILGDLGLFIGGGFSKSVMNRKKIIALSWKDMIYKSFSDLNIDVDTLNKDGLSFPELASRVCHIISEKGKITFEDATERLKIKIAEITNWYPQGKSKTEYGKYLKTIKPQWIITTNYDLIIESLLPGLCITLGPEEQLFIPKKLVPVYHIHGIRTNPKSLVITQEDYIRQFRPNEYRQSKLALILKESTTLFVGYGLGDINVLSAVDWAKNVFKGENHNYLPDIIQVVLVEDNPQNECYQDSNGTLILEINDLGSFFQELCRFIEEYGIKEKVKTISSIKYRNYLNPSRAMIEKFITEDSFRRELLKAFSDLDQFLTSGFLVFISRSIERAWENKLKNEVILKILLDLLSHLDYNKVPPAITELIISNLNKIEPFIQKNNALKVIWNNKRKEIPDKSINELKNISLSMKYHKVNDLLNETT